MKRKVRARGKHLERRVERPKRVWMSLCITSKRAELINPLITGLAGLLEEEALCWCQGRHQPMEGWHVDATVVSVLPPMVALFHSGVSSSKVLPLKKKKHTKKARLKARLCPKPLSSNGPAWLARAAGVGAFRGHFPRVFMSGAKV